MLNADGTTDLDEVPKDVLDLIGVLDNGNYLHLANHTLRRRTDQPRRLRPAAVPMRSFARAVGPTSSESDSGVNPSAV